jgi:hypothetical protein
MVASHMIVQSSHPNGLSSAHPTSRGADGASPGCLALACWSTTLTASISPSRRPRFTPPSASPASPSAISPALTTGPTRCASCPSASSSTNLESAVWAVSAPSCGASPPSPRPFHPVSAAFSARASARHRRSAYLSGQCQSHRTLVSTPGAQLCYFALRLRRQVLFGHRRAAHRPAAAAHRLALELRRHRPHQLLYFLLFSRIYRDPQDDPN